MEIDIEHKDWQDDESWRQRLPEGNPFGVPEGYFGDLCERIISGVHLEEITHADVNAGFTLPEDYFEQLSSNIQSRINIEKVLGERAESFTVPQDYFEGLSNHIQSRINVEKTLAEQIKNFIVPVGYFDELSSNIQSRINIEEALGEPTETFIAPQGYFDELNTNIQRRINVEEALGETAENFTIPQGYFDELIDNIQGRVNLEKAADAEHNVFAVPQGYFNELQKNTLSQTTNKQHAKVVKMPSRESVVRKLISTAAFKYASAACIALFVGIAVYVREAAEPATHDHTYLHKQLSEVPASEIRSYLETQTGATQTERQVIADGTQFDDAALSSALQDYVNAQ